MYEEEQTVELFGYDWDKSNRGGEGFLYRTKSSSGKQITRNRLIPEIQKSIVNFDEVELEFGNGYEGNLVYEGGEAEIEITGNNAVLIRSPDELEELLEPSSSPFS